MSIKRYGAEKSGAGGQNLPFARAVEADGWLYVSGQVAMVDGEVIEGGIIPQTHKAIQNLLSILEEANYTTADVVRCGIWLDDPRDFWSFNKIYQSYFGEAPPARACVQSSMMVDCKVEIDCVAYKSKA
ncbi:RidA family protein [Roseibium algae]|uniref:RidA family protein n=1 Tax=Roseibium algae TaxID=3123038 RepID=A0ABU8THU8_9HYPH